jgi:hypothetical protein
MGRLGLILACSALIFPVTARTAELPNSVTGPLGAADDLQLQIGEFYSRILNADPDIRLAGFHAMTNSGNPALFELAIYAVRARDDDQLRDLSARVTFSHIRLLSLVPDQDAGEDPNSVKDFVTQFGINGSLVLAISNFDLAGGDFRVETRGTGHFTAQQLGFRNEHCSASLGTGRTIWHYTGVLSCQKGDSDTPHVLNVHFDLR